MVSKIVHTSDLHLGMTFKSLGEKSRLHRSDCEDCFSGIIDLCVNEKVDALLIAGDFFDVPNPSKSLIKFVNKEFGRLEKNGIPVFISTGNHDPYNSGSVWLTNKFPQNVVIFDSSEIVSKRIKNITIYGLAYTDDIKKPLKEFTAEKEDNFKIGLIHGSTTNINWDEQPEAGYRPITIEDIEKSGLDYVALGHFHDFLQLNTKIPCYYSGSPEGLSFKNLGDMFVLLVTYDDGKVEITKKKTNKRIFKTIELDCTNYENDSQIRKVISQHIGENNILRILLKGSPPLDYSFDIDLLMKEYESKYFYLKVVDNVHIPEDLREDETIRGTFIKLMKEEINKEEDENKKKRLENALRLGIGYLDKKL